MYRIEWLPRYGVWVGTIWKQMEEGEENQFALNNEDAIGHVRVNKVEEQELWNQTIANLNGTLELKKEIKGLPAQRIEPAGYTES